jgi:hypothetical protein
MASSVSDVSPTDEEEEEEEEEGCRSSTSMLSRSKMILESMILNSYMQQRTSRICERLLMFLLVCWALSCVERVATVDSSKEEPTDTCVYAHVYIYDT